MKRTIHTLLAFVLINFSLAYGQKQAFIGITGGINKSQIIGDTYKGFYKSGFDAGMFSRFRLSENSDLHLELTVVNKGCSSKRINDTGKRSYFNILYYIQVPVLFRQIYKDFFFELGPGLGLLIWQLDYEHASNDKQLSGKPQFTEQNMNAGIGYTVNDRFDFGLRYTHSIRPIRRLPSPQYNSTISICAFYKLFFFP